MTGTADLPLAGVRVVDLVDGRAEMCGRLLADLGADVLRLEPPGGGRSRRSVPRVNGTSLPFVTHNANKRGAELDLTSAGGRVALLDLVSAADILVEGEPPGRMAALGLGVDVLHTVNPALVVTSVTEFGQTGPYRDWVATDFVHMALNSVLARSGVPDQPPLMPPGSLAGEVAAVQAAWATLVAFWQRLDTGAGDHVDVSILEASVQSFDPAFGIGGTAVVDKDARHLPRGRPDVGHYYPILPCADGHVRICVLNRRQWRNMRDWLGQPPELADPVWEDIRHRLDNGATLRSHYAALVAPNTRDELVELGRRHGVPVEGVRTPGEALRSAHLRARGAWAAVDVGGDTGLMPDGLIEVDGRRAGIRLPAPPAGGLAGFAGERPALERHPARPPGDTGPLQGLRVLDLGVIVVGAETGRLFADMGADVVKVESRGYPDGNRQILGMAPALAYGHRGKRSIGLNLREPAGKELFLRLARHADVVASNFRPGTMASLGLSAEVLREANPSIVVIESSALGSWGPASRNMGYGPLVRALTGLTSTWRYPARPDDFCDNITVYPDHTAARVGAVGVLAQLVARRRRGHGGSVRVAQAEVILSHLADQFLRESLAPGSFRPAGNAGEFDAPYGVYPCAGDDEWCAVTVRGDDDWRALCVAIDAPALAADATLATSAGRAARRERVDEAVAAWTAGRSPDDAAATLQAHGVPAGTMRRAIELPADPQLVSRGFFSTLAQPQLGELTAETGPARFARIDQPALRAAPMFGEHTREVAREWLGLGDDEIDDLIRKGVLEE